MRRQEHLVRRLGLAVMVVAGALQAQAAYYDLTVNAGPSQFAYGTIDVGGPSQPINWLGSVGALVLNNASIAGNQLPGTPFNTVCADLEGTLITSGNTYGFQQQLGFNNSGNGLDPRWGYGNQNEALVSPPSVGNAIAQAAVQNGADIFFHYSPIANGLGNTTAGQQEWAAIQLAVWEVLYDTGNAADGFNLSNGRFTANTFDATTLADANYMLTHLSANPQYVGSILYPDPVVQLNGNTAQAVFFNVTQVPEPTTIIAGALLLLPFGASTLRFVRKNRLA